MHLLLVSQTSQSPTSLPMGNNTPRVLIRREEAHNTAWYHVTNVGEDAARLVHLSANRQQQMTNAENSTKYYNKTLIKQCEYVYPLPCVESLGFGK